MSDIKVSFPSPCSEPWEGMAPAGCHRHCASCDKVIHNLEAMTVEDVEGLVASGEEVCVRARVAADGTVALAQGPGRGRRRLVATVGATMALAACQTPMVGPVTPRYQVTAEPVGWLDTSSLRLVAQDGTVHRPGRTKDGRYRFGNLKAGNHELVAFFTGKGPHDRDYKRGATIRFDKGTEPKYIELQIRDSQGRLQPEFEIKTWQ